MTHCSVWEEEIAPVVVHRREHGEEEGEQQHHDKDDHDHPRVQREVNLRQENHDCDMRQIATE